MHPTETLYVWLDDRLKRIKEDYIDEGSYFVINKGWQYGKTTMLAVLEKYLKDEYIVLSLGFQKIGTEDFANVSAFTKVFSEMVVEALEIAESSFSNKLVEFMSDLTGNSKKGNFKGLFTSLSGMCTRATKPIVLMIDEVDSASNNQVFSTFLHS